MTKEPLPPSSLEQIQRWFGGVISAPLEDASGGIRAVASSGEAIAIEAARHIAASPTLLPWQRIQIYNQQYWWRLIKVLQDSYPVVSRIFGYHDFNEVIAIPYLIENPPSHWCLSLVGEMLPRWLQRRYSANDKALVLNVATVDHAFNNAFLSRHNGPLRHSDFQDGEFLTKKIFLQPHIHLLTLPYNLPVWRSEFLEQEVEWWCDNPFPELLINGGEPFYCAIHNTPEHGPAWNEISRGEYALLSLFQQGCTIDAACSWLEKEDDDALTDNLQQWFYEWTAKEWLTGDPSGTLSGI